MPSVTRSLSSLPVLAASLSVASAVSINLPIWFRNTYALVEVEVGTPPQQHLLRFDTGSSTSWFIDPDCAGGRTCNNYSGYPWNAYDLSASSTGQALGQKASIEYFGGTTTGETAADLLTFPGAPDLQWNQTFLWANKTGFPQNPSDGFLGLAFDSIAVEGTTTVVETLIRTGQLDDPRFAIYFGKEFDTTGDGAGDGVMTIGRSEEDKYVDGELTWVEPLQLRDGQHQLWRTDMVKLTATTGNGTTGGGTVSPNGGWAIFDTGAGSISVPKIYAESLYESIGMNWTAIITGKHIPQCTEFTSDWSVSFHFGDAANPAVITLTGDQLARPGFANGSLANCWPPFDIDDRTTGLFLFGTPFLHQLYSVFDFGGNDTASYNPRVGFGELKAEYKP